MVRFLLNDLILVEVNLGIRAWLFVEVLSSAAAIDSRDKHRIRLLRLRIRLLLLAARSAEVREPQGNRILRMLLRMRGRSRLIEGMMGRLMVTLLLFGSAQTMQMLVFFEFKLDFLEFVFDE